MRIHITNVFAVRDHNGAYLPVEDLHTEGAKLMEALLDLEKLNEDVTDASTSSDGDLGTVTAELLVTADNEVAALEEFLTIVRTAIHAIGGHTPGWEKPADHRPNYHSGRMQLEPC